jgi:putative transposase
VGRFRPEGVLVHPAQGNALGTRVHVNVLLRDRSNGPTIPGRRTIGPLGRYEYDGGHESQGAALGWENAGPSARIGGWIDHVHVLCGLSRTVTVAELVEVLKRETSKWVKQRAVDLDTFHWQNGYGAFSVSQSIVDQVIEYIDRQPDHHGRMTFQDEFRAMCVKHHIQIDERYAWD